VTRSHTPGRFAALRRSAGALLLFVGAGAAFAALVAQSSERYGDTLDVNLVELEVAVTDARGTPLLGLTAADFRLRVDGRRVAIESVRTLGAGRLTLGSGGSAELPEPPRRLLIFLDESTMVAARRDFVAAAIVPQLAALAAEDTVAVVAFTGFRLELLCPWTTDRARTAEVLRAVATRPARGIHVEVARRQAANDVDLEALLAAASDGEAVAGGAPAGAATLPKVFGPALASPTEAAAAALDWVPSEPGRRLLLLLSESLGPGNEMRPLVDAALRAGVAIYPVDVRGLDTFRAGNDVESTAPQRTQWVTTGLDRAVDDAFTWVAAATGGRASLNSNRRLALERLVAGSAGGYLVAFLAPPARTPGWHSIRLEVVRRRAQVRTRAFYADAGAPPGPPVDTPRAAGRNANSVLASPGALRPD
jgi:VWFA-related protein